MRMRGGLRCLVRCERQGAGVKSQQAHYFLGGEHGRLEESGGARSDWIGGGFFYPAEGVRGCARPGGWFWWGGVGIGGDFVHQEEVSGGCAGHGGWFGCAGIGISGEVREGAAVAAGLFRTRHAGDGDGGTSRQADYRGREAERGGLGGDWGMKRRLPDG